MNTLEQNKKAQAFQALHHGKETLILANAWDCVSAKMVEQRGFSAIATSSASCAWSRGYKDGEHVPPTVALDVIKNISEVVSIPVTADIEGGYFRENLDQFEDFIGKVIAAGAVGVNIEDGYAHTERMNDTLYQMEEIKRARKAGKSVGVDVFINARTDAMISNKSMAEKMAICIEKATAFEEAGANGIFIPFITEMKTVEALKKAIKLPLNILISKTLNIEELKNLGVNRISTGARPMMATMVQFGNLLQQLKNSNQWENLFAEGLTYEELNSWFRN